MALTGIHLVRGLSPTAYAKKLGAILERTTNELGNNIQKKAEWLAQEVRNNIELGGIPSRPNDPEYEMAKFRASLDNEPLKATHQYMESIGVLKEVNGKVTRYFVGFLQEMHQGSKPLFPNSLPMSQLANILEYGLAYRSGQYIPPRPHWRPAWMRFKSKYMASKPLRRTV